jgi:hypothetical protein
MTTPVGTAASDFASLVTALVDGAARVSAMAAEGAWASVPLACVADLTAGLYRARDQLTASAIDGVGLVHTSGALPAGQVSTRRWLEVTTGMSARSAGTQLARSRSLREGYAQTRLAWLAGRISDDMVRAITTGIPAALCRLNVAELPDVVARIEAQIVPYAEEHSVVEVSTKLKRLRIALDEDGVDARSLAVYDEEQLLLIPVGDGYEVRGYLTKESAASLLTVLERTVDSWFHDGSLTPEQQALAGDDVRSRGRRRGRTPHLHAQALAEVCRQLLDDGDLGTKHQQRPHVTVTVDAAEYRAGLGGLLHLPGREPEPITSATVDRFLCDSDLTHILSRSPSDQMSPLTDHDGAALGPANSDAWLHDAVREVLYVGRTSRTATPRQRKALAVRDGGCQFPGCAVLPDRCRAHHVRFWSKDGRTDLDNLVLICERHHLVVHEQRWTVGTTRGARPGQPGFWTFAPPPRPTP